MTIKWVKVDPLVMNGEPFCYGTRLTVRNLLEMRANGLTPDDILGENPELRRLASPRRSATPLTTVRGTRISSRRAAFCAAPASPRTPPRASPNTYAR